MNKHSRRKFLASVGVGIPGALTGQPGRAEQTLSASALGQGPPPADPRDLPAEDARLHVRTIDTSCAPHHYKSRPIWDARATRLREQILCSAGLWPTPERRPLKAQIFDRIESDNFSVEKVYFESYPGFFCTGNLYRPLGGEVKAPVPGILCPHGHWNYGRLEHCSHEPNGCSVPQRCMNFAMQGYVAFAYDMIGYNDSFQVPHFYQHDNNAPWALTPEGLHLWLWGVSQLGLQLWTSTRALDFLVSLPDVDSERIGVTGASGGGTQTFLLTAVDDRVKVSAPVNMISHIMQGGCICENAPNLRIDTDNMELGGLAAPRPILMVSATGDWTRDTERVEYPAVAAIYELFGARDRVAHEQFPFQHNYNRSSREAVYRFFARWLSKDPEKAAPASVEEKGEFQIDPGHMLVFARRKPPEGALDAHDLMESLLKTYRDQLKEARPSGLEQLEEYRRKFGPVYRTALMAESPSADDLRWWKVESAGRQGSDVGMWSRVVLGRASVGDRIPGTLVQPVREPRLAALVVHPGGAQVALGSAASPTPLERELTRRDCLVLAIDLFQSGATLDSARQPVGNYFPAYNRTDDAQRVQDVLTALAYLEIACGLNKIIVVGQERAGLWCLLTRPFFSKPYPVAADVAGFENSKDEAYLDKLHIPLLRRAGDFQTAALLSSASPLLLHNLAGNFVSDSFSHMYALHAAERHLRISDKQLADAELVKWLVRR